MTESRDNVFSRLERELRLDEICDRFDDAWREGTRPLLRDFLAEVSDADQDSLFCELLAIDLEHRRGQGEQPTPHDYLAHYPAYVAQIDAALTDGRGATVKGGRFPPQPTHRGFHIRCPHCHDLLEVVDDRPLATVMCPRCGSSIIDAVGRSLPATRHDEPGAIVGDFELLERLGEGAFGTVWKARDRVIGRLVAVKIPRVGQLTRDELERFVREARLAGQVRHPHIVAVYEIGFAPGTVYIASELIEGCSLKDHLGRHRLWPADAATVCAKVAEALQAAHESGVVHCGLRPANILLDRDGVPHISDFGLAKCEAGEATITRSGTILGTAQYMSPEQVWGDGSTADRRSDIYSLGTILYELLTGETPFRGKMKAVLQRMRKLDPPAPRRLNPAIPRDLEAICLKCLAKDLGSRFQTAQALSDDLRRFLAGQPTRTRPLSVPQRAWKWCTRIFAWPVCWRGLRFPGIAPDDRDTAPNPRAPSTSSNRPLAGPHPLP